MEPDTDHANDIHHGTVRMIASGGRLLFLMLIILIFLHHAYSSLCRVRRHRHDGGNRRLFRYVFTTTSPSAQNRGLDPSLFKYLPTFTYSSATHPPLNDRAICLSESQDGDEGRVLPNCNHCFHSHCIEAWFRAHSICPMCRSFVKPSKVLKQTSLSLDKFVHCSDLPPAIRCPTQPLEVMEKTSTIIDTRDDGGSLRWTRLSELDLLHELQQVHV